MFTTTPKEEFLDEMNNREAESLNKGIEENSLREPLEFKTSFPPIANAETKILILGSLPGDRSLQSGEYFAHPRNRFWKIMATITGNPLPESYSGKKELLLKSGIGVWNVLHKANRKGSLDSAIENELPNDLTAFISAHKELKVIGFDGRKPEALFNKYFSRRSDLIYLSLPGCSPANARFTLDALCERWAALIKSRDPDGGNKI